MPDHRQNEQSSNAVFYTDDSGNLTLSGIIKSYGGNIGRWNIDNNGITTDDNAVGLYANDAKKYNNESIRFWAG